MIALWRRLLRLLRQNAIRLSAADLRPVALRPGDRLAFGSRWWRVRSPVDEPAGGPGSVEVVAEDAPQRRARIRLPDAAGKGWFEDGGAPVPFHWRDVLHLPAGSALPSRELADAISTQTATRSHGSAGATAARSTSTSPNLYGRTAAIPCRSCCRW